ncbi:MAG: hypothetical protein H6719_22540 [Sandaracinaceae bacterium]|nr:hypothetical protein [Sandaracinaceae bacterium]
MDEVDEAEAEARGGLEGDLEDDLEEGPEEPPSRARAWFQKHRTRLSQVALAIFLIAVAIELGGALPREVNVAFRFPAHAEVVEARIEYSQENERVRDVTLRWPEGAPALVRDDVELSPGDYDVSVLLLDAEGATRALRGAVTAPADGVVQVRLRE